MCSAIQLLFRNQSINFAIDYGSDWVADFVKLNENNWLVTTDLFH
jgi:hypothetical protein